MVSGYGPDHYFRQSTAVISNVLEMFLEIHRNLWIFQKGENMPTMRA